jgi:hypothetical protein
MVVTTMCGEAPGEKIEPVPGLTRWGVLSVFDGAGKSRLRVQLHHQAVPT